MMKSSSNLLRGRRVRPAIAISLAVLAIFGCWILMITKSTGPTWHNITIGKSTSEQVISELGPPAQVEHRFGADVYYYRSGSLDFAANKVIIQAGVVDSIEEDMSYYHPTITYLTEFIDRYGNPDRIMWAWNDPFLRVAVFPKHGVLVTATAKSLDEAQITDVFYFRPCSMLCVQLKYIDVFSPVKPPQFSNTDIVVGPQNPWEFNE